MGVAETGSLCRGLVDGFEAAAGIGASCSGGAMQEGKLGLAQRLSLALARDS